MRALCLLLAIAACKEPTAPREFFGKHIVPPMGLDRIRPGMTQAEALAALPTLKKRAHKDDVLELPTGVKDVELIVQGDPVARIVAYVKPPLVTHLRQELMDDWKDEQTPDHFRGTSWIANLSSYGDAAELEFWPKLDIKKMFAGGPAALPAALARVKPGMMKHEIESVLPPYVAKRHELPEEHTSFTLYGEDDPTGLASLAVYLNFDHREELLALWGPGELGQDRDSDPPHETHSWYAPTTGWRATYTIMRKGEMVGTVERSEDRLDYQHYIPINTLLGEGLELAMVASSPWGKKLEDVAKDFPNLHGNSLTLTLPPVEAGPRTGFFVLDADARIDTLVVRFNCAAKCATLAATFAQKWPDPKGDLYHATNPYVRIRAEGPELVMTYRPTPPPKGSTVY
jgi:hypothetical protein